MNVLKGVTVLLISLLMLSCGDDGGDANPGIEIRVRNMSTSDLNDVVVSANGEIKNFGTVAAFGETDYQLFQRAWDTADITATTFGLPASISVSDYTAATELARSRRYTYELSLNCSTTSCGILINVVSE